MLPVKSNQCLPLWEKSSRHFRWRLPIRSAFSGAFFTLSYFLAIRGVDGVQGMGNKENVPTVIALSLFAGFTTYSLHRSLVYPAIECLLDRDVVQTFRQGFAAQTVHDHQNGSQVAHGRDVDQNRQEYRQHITTWADYAHFQYSAADCVFFGPMVGCFVSERMHDSSWPMIPVTCVLFLGGLNIRLATAFGPRCAVELTVCLAAEEGC
jgi:hypothetical protein